MIFIKYKNMIIKFIGNDSLLNELNKKAVLGKGYIQILYNWCGNIDYILEYLESDTNDIKYSSNKIVLEGNINYLKKTTIIQSIVFMLYQKKNYISKIISLHSSAVVKGDTLIVFIGTKGSGKTSMSYIFSKKYEGIRLVANDYIEIKFNNNNTFTVIDSDYDSKISFRSHVLYNLDKDLYVKMTCTDKLIFDETIKTTANFVDLKKNTLLCKKLEFIFIGLGKTQDLEISQKEGIELEIELYKELVQYVRGKVVASIEEDKIIAPFYIESSYFFNKEIYDNVFNIIKQIDDCNNINVEWVKGKRRDVEEYLVKKFNCEEKVYE